MSPRERRGSYEESMEHFMTRISLIQQIKSNDSKDFDSYMTPDSSTDDNFKPEQMTPILLASLYPLFEEYMLECKLSAQFNTPMPVHDDSTLFIDVKRDSKTKGLSDFSAANSISTDSYDQQQQQQHPNRLGSIQTVDIFATCAVLPTLASVTLDSADNSPVAKKASTNYLKMVLKKSKKLNKEATKIKDIYVHAADALLECDAQRLLSTGSWFQQFVSSIEELSLSVSIACALPESPGFPLVYVNKAFEAMTQYSREE
eukprot:gene27467-34187_t